MGDDTEEDPFSMFDDGDDANGDAIAATTPLVRDDVINGPMSHPSGVEQALCQFVENRLRQQKPSKDDTTTCSNRVQNVLKAVDDFCFQRHWMMHVGVRHVCFR